MKEEKDFDEATGKVYLTQLAQLVPRHLHVESYARSSGDKYELRTLMQAAGASSATPAPGSRRPPCCWIPRKSASTTSAGQKRRGPAACAEILLETFDRLDKLNSADRDKYKGLPTGIKELDNTITG